jgi:hypothetical protein
MAMAKCFIIPRVDLGNPERSTTRTISMQQDGRNLMAISRKAGRTTHEQIADFFEEHLPYEISMLRYTLARLLNVKDAACQNVLIESFCLHGGSDQLRTPVIHAPSA